jgi:hypothetical protein
MLIELYFNVPEYKSYFSASELYFDKPIHWKKLSMLSATFGKAPMTISQEMKDLIAAMVNPFLGKRCKIE